MENGAFKLGVVDKSAKQWVLLVENCRPADMNSPMQMKEYEEDEQDDAPHGEVKDEDMDIQPGQQNVGVVPGPESPAPAGSATKMARVLKASSSAPPSPGQAAASSAGTATTPAPPPIPPPAAAPEPSPPPSCRAWRRVRACRTLRMAAWKTQRAGAPHSWGLQNHIEDIKGYASMWNEVDMWAIQEVSLGHPGGFYHTKCSGHDYHHGPQLGGSSAEGGNRRDEAQPHLELQRQREQLGLREPPFADELENTVRYKDMVW